MAGAGSSFRPMPNAAWAWEGLRKNWGYRQDYLDHEDGLSEAIILPSGARLIRQAAPCPAAQKWGLLRFANPFKPADQTDVFWRPDIFSAALRVEITAIDPSKLPSEIAKDIIVLSAIKTRRVMLDTPDGLRHVLLSGSRFWIQLHGPNHGVPDDHAEIEISMKHIAHMNRRIDTARQLLSLYKSGGHKLSLIGRKRDWEKTARALTAFDIHHGIERPKGSLKDIAEMIVGPYRIAQDWGTNDRNLKRQARCERRCKSSPL